MGHRLAFVLVKFREPAFTRTATINILHAEMLEILGMYLIYGIFRIKFANVSLAYFCSSDWFSPASLLF